MTSPDYTQLVLAVVAVEPSLHPQHVREALPAALACLRAVCHGKSKPVLPEPPTAGPVDDRTAWEGGGR